MSSESPINPGEISDHLQSAGVAGAGGAGFPSYVKWQDPLSVNYLLVNHQESEPNYYADKWLGQKQADEFGNFLQQLVDEVFDAIVIGTKAKYRDEWIRALEDATGASTYSGETLPIPIGEENGIIIAYTPDVYVYSKESVLLTVAADVQIKNDLPTEHGWIVHNTETLYNIQQALRDRIPVTRKYVQVDGNTPSHRCLDVPIGTPATELLAAAGLKGGQLPTGSIIADGGPGWCYKIDCSADEFGVRKRTNGLLVLDADLARGRTMDDGQIDVLLSRDWDREHETVPVRLDPSSVRIPLISNQAYEGLVAPSVPIVEVGDYVEESEVIARPDDGSISNTQHASIDGTVTEVSATHVVIEAS